ncbi:MAG: hypothetical protein MJZ49_00805 [Bacteroidales bacterium]|nr:hypothetical protein [Bacteroidales bacterium]
MLNIIHRVCAVALFSFSPSSLCCSLRAARFISGPNPASMLRNEQQAQGIQLAASLEDWERQPVWK